MNVRVKYGAVESPTVKGRVEGGRDQRKWRKNGPTGDQELEQRRKWSAVGRAAGQSSKLHGPKI